MYVCVCLCVRLSPPLSLSSFIYLYVYVGGLLGSLEHLLSYETERQRRVIPMMAGIDALNRLYSNRLSPVVLLRNLGCHLTQSLTPIKVDTTSLNILSVWKQMIYDMMDDLDWQTLRQAASLV